MGTISLRLTDEQLKLLKDYTEANNLNMSSFVREAVFNYMEKDFELDEERILRARSRMAEEKTMDHTEVWKELGV